MAFKPDGTIVWLRPNNKLIASKIVLPEVSEQALLRKESWLVRHHAKGRYPVCGEKVGLPNLQEHHREQLWATGTK